LTVEGGKSGFLNIKTATQNPSAYTSKQFDLTISL
jgi:hypothetical protein